VPDTSDHPSAAKAALIIGTPCGTDKSVPFQNCDE
jgi:hypothetical protein